MARFDIISKDGSEVRFSGKPRYNGSYLKPSYLEFSEIASPTPIAWEVGDYVDYPRTGMRYRLYSIPQASKNARRDTHGKAFTYSNVQLHAATKELEIALFRDLVDNDNNIHFSTSPDVATFEDVYGIARRIQACMDDLYPDRWEIRVADFDEAEDAEVIENITTAKDFAMSGGTCLDALSKIYELWQDIGWIHSYENGKEVITIGYANKRIGANTTESYLYGKGNGLTAIKKNQSNKDEFATRLYVYGSDRNLPARYYNGKDILNAESVDIRNLMLPMDSWGKTDDLPDARKAYLENAEAVAKFGVIPRVHYFDSDDAGADIYPSIKGMTIGTIRKALTDMGQTQYSPSTEIYTNSAEAVDEIRTAVNPSDNGIIREGGNEYKVTLVEKMGESVVSANIPVLNAEVPILVDHLYFSSTIPADFTRGEIMIDPSVEWHIEDAGFDKVEVLINIRDNEDVDSSYVNVKEKASVEKSADGSYWIVKPPRVRVDYDSVYEGGFPLYIFVRASGTRLFEDAATIDITFNEGELFIGANEILDKTFHVTLKQIGFDINLQASLGKGKTISMTTGACAGRNFVIDACYYSEVGDFWALDLKRQKDNTLGMLFPNKDYQIASGDKFVLLDIAMPDVYVNVGMERLLAEGQKLLARASKIQTNYEPSIDAVVMAESGRTLREGMFMEITDEDVVDNGTDYILIDTLNIYEDESAIPTYKVTLRERRKVTYKGTPSATSSTDTESVGDESADVNVDLSDYYTREEVDSRVGDNASRITTLEGFWYDEDGVLTTDKAVRIKNNLIVNGDTASGGEGEDTPAIGTVIGVSVDGVKYTDVSAGILDLTAAFKNVSVDLSDYYTKNEVNALIDKITAGEIDLANYYTKEQIDEKGFLTSSALDGYAKESWVSQQIANIDFSNYYTIAEVDKKISDLNIGQYATTEALTSGLSAKQDTISDLATIRSNAKNGATAYGWGNHASAGYAKATDVPTLTAFDALRSEFDALESALNDDVSGKINTWNEIVDFLDEYSGSEDLATILAGINSDIANVNTIVEGHTSSIGSNASAIGVLQGYFTNGVAKKATADANGNVITSYYTPISTHNALATRVTTIETWKTDLSRYITIVDGNVKISTNLIVSGDTASGGDGEDTAAIGTVTGIKVNGTTYNPTAGIVTIPDYPTSLEWNAISGKPTKLSEFTNDAGFITSHQTIYALTIKNSAGTTQLTYTPNSGAGSLTLTKAMVGLANVDNTADANKSVKYATSAGSAPASDVYAWAKASTKPAYTTKEVTESGNLYFTNARAVAALTDTLASYATQSWVEGKKYLTSHQAVVNTGNTLSFGSAIIIGSVGEKDLTVELPSVASVKSTLGLGSLAYLNSLSKSDVGLGNVENKSSATIRGELTSANVTTALGYTPYNATNPNGYITATALNGYATQEFVNSAIAGIDLSPYATKTELTALDNKYSSVKGWYDLIGSLIVKDGDNIRIKTNLIVEGDTASGGEGEDTPAIGTVTGVSVNGVEYSDVTAGILDLSDAFNSVSIDLSDYYTKVQVDNKIAGLNIGQYATVTALNAVSDRVLTLENAGYATTGYVDTKIANLINGAPTTLDTLKEIADALAENEDVVDALEAAIGTKANASDLTALAARVTTNEGSIASLSSGKADKATTLAGYGITNAYTKTEVDGKVTTINTSITAVSNRVTTLESWKTDIAKYITIVDGNVKISTNLIVSGDTASGGDGEDTAAIGTVTGVEVNGVKYIDVSAGILDLSDAFNNVSVDLSDYYTKAQIDEKGFITSHQTIYALTIKNSAGTTQLTYTPNSGAGSLTLTKAMVGLANVDNTADANKSVKYATSAGSAPASDVYAWAKASTKPAYTTKEVTESGNLYFTNARAVAALTDTLASYATQSWVEGKKYLTSHQAVVNTGNTLSFGSAIIIGSVGEKDLTVELPSVASVKSTLGLGSLAYKSSLVASDIPSLDWSKITSGKPTTLSGYGITDAYTASTIDSKLAGYLPLSGGTISGTVTFSASNPAMKLYRASGTPYLCFGASASAEYGEIGVNTNGDAVFWSLVSSNSAYNAWRTLIHSGNIGSQSVKYATSAGSATKLATARSIWGQSFDGTGNVTGALSGVTNINGAITINSSGNVTIGSSDLAGTSYKLYVNGKIRAKEINYTDYISHYDSAKGYFVGLRNAGLGTTDGGLLLYSYGATPMSFYTNNFERIHITSDGNIGISTTSPAYKLDVAGTGRFTSTLTVGGATTIGGALTVNASATINGNLVVTGDVASA